MGCAMPQPPLSPRERSLASFCRFSAIAYFAAALGCAAWPAFPDTALLGIVAAALLTAMGAACLVTASRPRELRPALWPVIGAQFVALTLSVFRLGTPGAKVVSLAAGSLLLLTLFIYRSAAPGIRREAAPAAPKEPEAPPAPVALGIKKAN
jgi:hypothetical protein